MSSPYIIEENRPFSQSKLWDLQTEYFERAGPDAWSKGQVPHYITSNPHIARNYAELIFAFFRDQYRRNAAHQPVRILELGAGTGKLAYNLLRCLDQFCEDAPFPTPHYTYILSDLPRANLDFWKGHPRFQPYFERGVLDVAKIDANHPKDIYLEVSDQMLEPLLQQGPLIIVANYFFDSIPQDLFRIQGYNVQSCKANLYSRYDPSVAPPEEVLYGLYAKYSYEPLDQPAYNNKVMDDLLGSYAGKFEDTHLLFPHIGIKLLQSMRAAAPRGLMLLSADKGEHRLEDLKNRGGPTITKHGSFSLQVNYHALREYCRISGGLPLATSQMHFDIDLHCMLFFPNPDTLGEVQHTFRHYTDSFGPDNFFGVKKAIEKQAPEMNFREIIGSIKLSRNDPRLFGQLLPRLYELAPELPNDQALTLLQTAVRVWENHFPLGEDVNLAKSIALLLQNTGFDKEAEHFFEVSRQLHRGHPKF